MDPMPSIVAVSTALPPHVVRQDEAVDVLRRIHAGREDLLKLLRVFATSGVEQRHTAFPPEYYLRERGFEERNRDFIEQGVVLAERAVKTCLQKAGVKPEQVDHFYLVTTTGLATPSLDALLAPRLGLRPDARRWPLFGLGCAGGAGALIRAADVLRGNPGQKALVVSVELCGQVFSAKAATPTDIIGAALFGDGAAAALVAEGPGPRLLATRTQLFEGTQHLMGWAFTSDGMRLRLSKEVTDFVEERLKPVVTGFLDAHSMTMGHIAHWVLHPGGRRILETYRDVFGLNDRMLQWTRGSLARVGNLSSASVLFILADLLDSGRAHPGDRGLLCALGPGFASELALLGW
jgi:alkylresorcinol/alkylpyrone synthase